MVAFPQLEPFRRGWSFGEYGMTEEPVWASVPVRFRHGRGSTQNVGQVLSLSFVDLYEDEVELIRAHYVSRDGGTLAFSLPSIVWAGLTAPPVPSTVSWVYQDVPVEVQKSGGLYDVTLSLLSVVAAGDGGGSVFADGFTETITMSFFGGAATSAQEGIRETVTVSLVGGEAIEALNGLRQTVAVTLAAGAADGGAGNVAGAAFTVNVSIAAGAGTSEVAGAALTVTVSLAAGAADAGVATNTSLLLNFNGSNGSTTFTDSSGNGLTVTGFGNAQISTAQSQHGGSSLLLDGTGDYLTVATSTLLDLPADFTVEFWVRPSAAITTNGFVTRPNSGGINPIRIDTISGQLRVSASSNGSSFAFNMIGGTFTANTWQHVAVTRQGNVWRSFIGGTQVGTTTSSITPYTSTDPVIIGARTTSVFFFNGYIDDLRIKKGEALYTASFTPPTAELTP
jgi:hypothetical protein